MYRIEIYENRNGESEIISLMEELNDKAKKDKSSRIRLRKIAEYIEILKKHGLQAGAPIIKHITNTELWELRPTNDRIFFFYRSGNTFVLLHHFVKKTRKTPQREIEKAQSKLIDYLEREGCCYGKKLG